jgi:hypothetical protein
VLPALEEVAVILRKAGWLCEVRAGDKDPGVHFTVYRGVKAGVSGGEKPFMTYQPEKQKNNVLINVATKASAAPVGRCPERTLPCAHVHARAREIIEEFRLRFHLYLGTTATAKW